MSVKNVVSDVDVSLTRFGENQLIFTKRIGCHVIIQSRVIISFDKTNQPRLRQLFYIIMVFYARITVFLKYFFVEKNENESLLHFPSENMLYSQINIH
jgi:hypothetical protein